jgi:hypothetical protein
VPDDPVTDAPLDDAQPLRPVDVVLAGHRGDVATARRGFASLDPAAREVAIGALDRLGALDEGALVQALSDDTPAVRRRACDIAATFDGTDELRRSLSASLHDDDALVVEAACWALGEQRTADAIPALSHVARSHADIRAREAAVAALGAIGEPAGLGAVLDALGDKPTVRRRAVVALAAFEGEEVTAALERAAADRDWQVREVAEILRDQ